ncbi:Auxilin-related protein 2 [Linum grandiflorum]
MDDFPGILARDFGFKPQGKSAPMAAPRNSNTTFSSSSFGGTEPTTMRSASSLSNKSSPVFDDHDRGGDGLMFNDVFGGPPKYGESRGGNTTSSSSASFDYDSIFKEKSAKSSLPVFDKPVYDEDIFDGLPGLRSSSSASSAAKFDDVFATVGSASPPKHKSMDSSAFDDLLGNLGKKGAESRREAPKVEKEKDSPAFDDLLPGFGRSSSPSVSRPASESSRSTRPTTSSVKTAPSTIDDPFVVLESTSTPAAAPSSSESFPDPLDDIGRFNSSGTTNVDGSHVHRGSFDDLDPLENLSKSVPPASSKVNERAKERSPLRSGASMGGTFSPASQDPVDKYPVENSGRYSQHNQPFDDLQETPFGMAPGPKVASQPATAPPSYTNVSADDTFPSPVSEEVSESADEIWLTVSEIPLFTKPTSAPPPSRPPPPRPPRLSARKRFNEQTFSNSRSPSSAPAPRSSASQFDELDDFATGRTQNNANDRADSFAAEEGDTDSSTAAAAAMKDAMDKAEAKIRHMRERDYMKASRSKESTQVDRDVLEAEQRELRERERQERLDRERQQSQREAEEQEHIRLRELEREREEKEREQKRQERERERVERERARQAVERATREARERAAADARLRAERVAVGKAGAEARERAERAAVQRAQAERVAVQRAQAEARERAAAEAKERAERAAAEARERANAGAREKDRDARARSDRVAVERAAAEARERAAAAARSNQQKNEAQPKHENDLESFFSSRPSSAPRPRAATSDPFFDTAYKGAPEAPKSTSVGSTSSMRKASSATNIVDDLSSIFGVLCPTFNFKKLPELDNLEVSKTLQGKLKKDAKALAEKNQRDLNVQMEQEERHRIAETLDFEIKRWSAGKEGNLRALLSTLQYVLWPECGWQPVSLTDLITAASVKKVYRKATLCIHPDKVQQKGANLQQKYIAEKVFDLLKFSLSKPEEQQTMEEQQLLGRRPSISTTIIFTILLLLPFLVTSQPQNADSCTSNEALSALSGLPFDPSSLTQCLPAWTAHNYILRYSQESSNVWSFLLSARDANSYVAVGFSTDGEMVGSSAVVGWMPADGSGGQVKQYYLSGQTPGQVIPDQGNLMIGSSAIVSQQSRLYMAFQLNTSQPSNILLYSMGPPGRMPAAPAYTLTEHRDKVSTTLNYVTGEVKEERGRPYLTLRRSHGIMNMVGWGILMILGAILARYFKHLDPLWFYAHVLVQSSGFVLGIIGVITGLLLQDDLDARHVSTHKALGILVLVLGCLQVMALMLRPEKSTKYRVYWNFYHYTVGRILMAFAITNVFYGIHLGGEGSGWNGGYGAVLSVLFVTIVVLEFRMRFKQSN